MGRPSSLITHRSTLPYLDAKESLVTLRVGNHQSKERRRELIDWRGTLSLCLLNYLGVKAMYISFSSQLAIVPKEDKK